MVVKGLTQANIVNIGQQTFQTQIKKSLMIVVKLISERKTV